MGSDFNYTGLSDREYEVYRTFCFQLRDPSHVIPTRCHKPYGHTGKHASPPWKGLMSEEEWEDEDAG